MDNQKWNKTHTNNIWQYHKENPKDTNNNTKWNHTNRNRILKHRINGPWKTTNVLPQNAQQQQMPNNRPGNQPKKPMEPPNEKTTNQI